MVVKASTKDPGLPPGWELRWSDKYKRPYCYKENEGRWDSTWDAPEGTNREQLKAYIEQEIEASHLLIKHKGSRNPRSWREVRIFNAQDFPFSNNLYRQI
jgi:NIMA-interacting peptidyl-prolyl cis-trans isomerase 1